MDDLMWKLLNRNVSKAQIFGFSIANIIGLAIVVLAVQFYCDVRPLFDDEDSFIGRDYLVMTRKVSGMGALLGANSDFSASDLSELRQQPWVRKVGEFVASDYSIYANVAMGGSKIGTQMFFESIPTEFIDIDTSEWHFDSSNPEIPVIISKDYLALYNFGFAAAQGMPKISEGMIGMVPLDFTLSGNGLNDTLPGRIVGFSNRLNTIIVPMDFMKWSNARYGSGEAKAPARIIVESNSPGDVKIEQYVSEKGYEIAGDKLDSSKANYFLLLIISIVVVVGLIISALSFFVLILSIYLLLQKSTQKLRNLLLLGYSPSEVSRPYIRLVLIINLACLALSVLIMLMARWQYMQMLSVMGVNGATLAWSILAGAAIISATTIGDIIAIRRKIASLWLQ